MKKILVLRGKRISSVGFFGLGKSSLAILDYLSENYEGLRFILRSDKKVAADSRFSAFFFGDGARKNITEDVCFLSPSVRRDTPEFQTAKNMGVILSSDVEFFFENKKIPVFSVTGSDGKSTTASLLSAMLSSDTASFPASANIGLPMTSLLNDEKTLGTVAELSSFQLMNFAPKSDRALITNISENHLDWHTSFEEYVNAKENVLRFAEKRVFNLDCPYNLRLLEKYPAFAVFSRSLSYNEMQSTVTANHYFSIEDGYVSVSGKPIFKADEIRLKGKHNLSNLLAAMALSAELVSRDKILQTAKTFEGLTHRSRLVGIYDGISFLDSSIDSTPTRTKTTLDSINSKTVLILGGKSKNLSYSPLFPLKENIKAIILTGENRGEIMRALLSYFEASGKNIKLSSAEKFSDAVLLAIKAASRGDTVLLSPASTSFDAFSDYKERGNAFSSIIKKYYADK